MLAAEKLRLLYPGGSLSPIGSKGAGDRADRALLVSTTPATIVAPLRRRYSVGRSPMTSQAERTPKAGSVYIESGAISAKHARTAGSDSCQSQSGRSQKPGTTAE